MEKKITNNTLINNEIDKASDTKNSKKKVIANIILLLVNLSIVAYIVISYLYSGEAIKLKDLSGIKINYFYLIACFALLLSVLLLDSFRYYRLIYSFSKVKSYRVSYLVSAYGKYYDYITPFGSGGQPFQMYFLHKSNLDGDTSMTVPIARFLFNHMSLLLFFLFSLVYGVFSNTITWGIVFIISLLAFVGNLFFIAMIYFISLKKNLCYKICLFFLNILYKIHLIKNYENTCEKLSNVLDKYQYNLKKINSNKKEFIVQILAGLVTIILNYTFVYFIYLSFASNFANSVSFLNIVTSMVICEMISSVMPLPGGSGAAEFSFISLFTAWFAFSNGKNIVVWAMLIWRIFTYYFYIFQGLIITIKDTIRGGIKKDKKFIKEKEAVS